MLNEEIESRLARERRARLSAEHLLAQKQRELSAANEKLSRHAFDLSDQIVEQRHEAEELKDENFQVRSDLHKAEQRLWTSVETIEDGFAVFDSTHKLILANAAFLSAFDGVEDVRPGVTYPDLLRLAVEEGLVDTQGQKRAAWCATMAARWDADQIEPVIVRLWNGGSVKLVERRGAQGDIVMLALDITETIRKERQLTDARKRAEAASRAKSNFLAKMSHELRTPMNGVVGMAALLGEGALDEEQRLYVDTIHQSGEALLQIINEVLDFSKMEASKLELNPQPFNLERVLHDVVVLALPEAQNKGIRIALDIDMFLPETFLGDQGRLRQILTNLIGNAVKFTTEGYVAIRVVGLPVEEGVQDVIVNVEDTGIGVPPEMVDHIFGEFNQAEDDKNRNFEGTGLGLAITRRLITLMGGTIWVDSEPGQGSCFSFRVRLPVVGNDPVSVPKAGPRKGARVLLVEPDPLARDVLFKQLIGMGLTVAHAGTKADAVRLIEGAEPLDFLLTDIALPDGDGIALAHKAHTLAPNLPVILVSRILQGQMDPADRALFSMTLTQPVLRADLSRALGQVAPDVLPSNEEHAPLSPNAPPMPCPQALPAECPPAFPVQTPPDGGAELGVFASRRSASDGLADHKAPVAEPPETAHAPARRMRVLAAEDNRTNQLVLRKMLADFNIDLVFAGNGEEAVAQFSAFQPDIIFMDISMPRMDGMEATRLIRAQEAGTGRHTPISAMTAHAMQEDEDRILAAGLDYYLTKPLRKADLRSMLERFVTEDCAPLRLDTAAE